MKKIVLLLAIMLSGAIVYAQNQSDVLRYSKNYYGGTARFNSMGGAFSALGGDISSLSINPAGIGIFRNSVFSFTPAYVFDKTTSTYALNQNSYEELTHNLNINNIGFVTSVDVSNASDWKAVNFGVSYNLMQNFHQNYTIGGVNDETTLADYYVHQANRNWDPPQNEGDALGYPAYDSYYVYGFDSVYNEFWSFQTDHNDTAALAVRQREFFDNEGTLGEFTFSFGANYAHKLYLGASIGLQRIRYKRTTNYTEHDEGSGETDVYYWEEYEEQEHLNITGSGFNLKLGAIYRPIDALRIGVAFHTPTFFSLEDEYYTSARTYFNEPGSDFEPLEASVESEVNYFEYDITTPSRLIGSLAYIHKKLGLVSVEYEYVDYTSGRIRADDFKFPDVNDAMSTDFVAAHNLRAGAEIRIAQAFSLRGGYAYYGNPYHSDVPKTDEALQRISGGVGINSGGIFFDFTLTYDMQEASQVLYDLPHDSNNTVYKPTTVTKGDLDTERIRALLSIGFRF